MASVASCMDHLHGVDKPYIFSELFLQLNVHVVPSMEALPGVLWNRGTRALISGEQGNKGQVLRGAGEQRQYWGTGNIENKFSILG